MKCSCGEEIEFCDGCGDEFDVGDDIVCDHLTRKHYCQWQCHEDLQEGEVEK